MSLSRTTTEWPVQLAAARRQSHSAVMQYRSTRSAGNRAASPSEQLGSLIERIICEIMPFLHSHGSGRACAVRIYRTYGADAVQVIRLQCDRQDSVNAEWMVMSRPSATRPFAAVLPGMPFPKPGSLPFGRERGPMAAGARQYLGGLLTGGFQSVSWSSGPSIIGPKTRNRTRGPR